MPAAGVALLTAALCGVVLVVRLRWSFALTVAACVLVPPTLPFVTRLSPYLPASRAVVLALGLRLLLDLRAGRLPATVFRWTPVHTAFTAFLVIVYAAAVVPAQPGTDPQQMTVAALNLAEQFLVLVIVLACVRGIGDLRWVLGAVGAVLLASCGIGIVEHATGSSWGHWLFGRQVARSIASNPLETRVGKVRVRAGAEYALQFAWVTAMTLPVLLAWAGSMRVQLRRWLPLVAAPVAVVVLAEYWAYSRTALAALGAVAVVTAVAARHRRLLVATLTVGVAGVIAFYSAGVLQNGYVGLPSGYASVRTYRLPPILAVASEHPLHGLGLGGLSSLGVVSTDTSYVQLYADAGLVSLAALAVLLVVAAVACVPGLRAADPATRLAAAAGVAGCLAMIAGGFAYDALRSPASSRPFWIVAAIGLVASERAAGPLRGFMRVRARTLVAVAVAAAAAGLLVLVATPRHYARLYEFSTISPVRETQPLDPVAVGQTMIHTVCGVATVVEESSPGTLTCRDLKQAAGVGELRVQSPSPQQVTATTERIRATVADVGLRAFALDAQTPVRAGRPTAAQWAPVWLPVVAVLALLLLPAAAGRGINRSPDPPPEVTTG